VGLAVVADDRDPDDNADVDADDYADEYADPDDYADEYADPDPQADSHADEYSYPHADEHADEHADSHAYPHAHRATQVSAGAAVVVVVLARVASIAVPANQAGPRPTAAGRAGRGTAAR
jgi:hypothetical protein